MARVRLNEVLKSKKITKYGFAKLLGVPTGTVSTYFRGGYDPKLSTLAKWAKALDVNVKDLIED